MTSTYVSFRIHFSFLVDDVYLRYQSYCLKPYWEWPAEFKERVVLWVGMNQYRQDKDGGIDVDVMSERVSMLVVSEAVWLFESDQVYDVDRQTNIQEFHHCQVDRSSVPQYVAVSKDVDEQEHLLGTIWDLWVTKAYRVRFCCGWFAWWGRCMKGGGSYRLWPGASPAFMRLRKYWLNVAGLIKPQLNPEEFSVCFLDCTNNQVASELK